MAVFSSSVANDKPLALVIYYIFHREEMNTIVGTATSMHLEDIGLYNVFT